MCLTRYFALPCHYCFLELTQFPSFPPLAHSSILRLFMNHLNTNLKIPPYSTITFQYIVVYTKYNYQLALTSAVRTCTN